MSGATTPATEAPALQDRDVEPRTPMKRLGSTRKLAAFSNIRIQLSEQTRVLEARAEAAAGVAGELHEYCRRRADLEHEYSRALDKLARTAHQRHKDQKHKREQWPLTGAFACWQAALENTRALSRDHAALGELYGGPLAARLQRAADDALRLHRKCRDIVAERHEEVGGALAEAGCAGKAHAAAAAEWRAAAVKLRRAHDQRLRLAAQDPPRHKKLKALDKELEKRRARHSEARARALRARADYALSLEAANATLQRYYLDDIADIMLCAEVGFEAVVARCVRCAGAAEGARGAAAAAAARALAAAAPALDALLDRQRLLDHHAAAFALPCPLPYHGDKPDKQDADMRALVEGAGADADAAADAALAELRARLQQLDAAARLLHAECQESAKTLDAAEAELVRQMEGGEERWDVSGLFGPGAVPGSGALAAHDDDPDARRDQEDYYLAKFRAYVSCAGRLARVEARAGAARARLGGAGGGGGAEWLPPSPPRRAWARARRGRFAPPLEERLPTVLTSCVRVIATYGLKHQGVFRVSGSQVEMQALRAAFERGEDPLWGGGGGGDGGGKCRGAADVNTVCGLLKLFLRSVRPPLLPARALAALLALAQTPAPDDAACVRRLRQALAPLPAPNLLVLRYLFAFLAHLTEYSEYNMMDAWNLAICLGPTLLAAGGEGGQQVATQNQLNELVKRMILHHRDVFPQDIAPHALYTRFPTAEETDELDSRDDQSLCDDDDDEEISEDGESGEWQDSNSAENGCGSAERRPSTTQEPPAGEPCASGAPCRRLAESTPDLVLDLPARAAPAPVVAPSPSPDPAAAPLPSTEAEPATPADPPSSPAPEPAVADSTSDSADTFLHNRDTLKKRPARRTPGPEDSGAESDGGSAASGGGGGGGGGGGSDGEAAAAGGSPVPARNTARVAAKFADLTLTGGSLKPALAAKPALLRRPTPHPRAAPPPPALPHPDPSAPC